MEFSSQRRNMTNSVPEKWLDYKAYGNVIEGTKILAFKVPLKDAITRNLQPEQRFTTAILLQAFPGLKYIVDLTNTYRYYDKEEFTNAGVKYEKIAVPGRMVPPMDIIKRFFKVMDDFISACGEGELIGVHCTHGVNRTGYLICRYLIQQLGWEIQDSLKAFEEARGHPIERDIYLSALSEIQRGEKFDTSKITLTSDSTTFTDPNRKNTKKKSANLMGLTSYTMSRRSFTNNRPFSSRRFAGPPPPRFGPMPHPPGIPSIPPMSPPLYELRRFRYIPPLMRQATSSTSPGPGFPHPGFPPRMQALPRLAGPSRLPIGPTVRLPPVKMPPPLPPPPPPLSKSRQFQTQKKHQITNKIMDREVHPRRKGPDKSRIRKEQDFTVDTFEENLLATSIAAQPRQQTRRRSNQMK